MQHRSSRERRDRPFLDIVSYGRRAPSERELRLLPAQIEQITRTVRHAPEVMVKISGGGQSAKAVAAHFRYIGRQAFEIETDHGEHIRGQEAQRALIGDWELELDAAESRSPYRGASGRKPAKLVHNIVLSMPKGAPAAGVLEASRAFAREQFALKHRYALVLHTDQPHPHVHLVVKAMSEQGRRINIRKETLREWRRSFASQLRAQGIAANATERAVRGVTKPRKSDGIYRAMRAGRSTHMHGRRIRCGSSACRQHAGRAWQEADSRYPPKRSSALVGRPRSPSCEGQSRDCKRGRAFHCGHAAAPNGARMDGDGLDRGHAGSPARAIACSNKMNRNP